MKLQLWTVYREVSREKCINLVASKSVCLVYSLVKTHRLRAERFSSFKLTYILSSLFEDLGLLMVYNNST